MSLPLDFLKQFRPNGPWVLTAIPVEGGKLNTATFGAKDGKKVNAWLKKFGDDHNFYFSVNPTISAVDKKASRQDIACVEYLHVDVDPRAGEPLTDEQPRILEKIREFKPTPTCVIFSGGGYQAFWRLEEPIQIGGDVTKAEAAKRYNMQLEVLLGGDNCHDISRIMRLPGTMNRPNAKKRKKGREEVMAELTHFDSKISYPLSTFTAAQQVQTSASSGFSGGKSELTPKINTGNIQRIADLDELGDMVKGWVKVLINVGRDPDDPTRFESRSETLFCVCCELHRAGIADDVIFSIITDKDFEISKSVLELGSRAEAYALRQIERSKEWAIDPALKEINERHAVISSVGGKCRVISEEHDFAFDRPKIEMQTFADFSNRYMHRKVKVGEDKNGADQFMPMGKWWLQNVNRRQFDAIVFVPGQEVPGAYNLWRGFTCEAIPGSCDKFLDHVKNNVCRGEEEHYNYLMAWLADAVQNPNHPGGTAVVMRGKQGTGKSFFAKAIGKLWGQHFLHISNSKHLVGSFNAHLRDCVMLFADEAFFAGDKKSEGILKALITEEHIVVEAKGIDSEASPNYIHLIMASNSEWVVPVAMDDRRFFVLDVADDHRKDTKYFGDIADELEAGGYEALLHHLITYDLNDIDLREAPDTDALNEQKQLNLSPEESWWYDILHEGRVLPRHEMWETAIAKEELLNDFIGFVKQYAGNYMNRCSMHRLTKFLTRVMPAGYPGIKPMKVSPQPGASYATGLSFCTNPLCYILPTLEECRNSWNIVAGFSSEWQDVTENDDKPPF
ncbi:hypothetical protein KAR91_01700 [Candidatus Pacearchaeota archaeon]|nr:hypothetical protein [Candidatus Pacearchaeota archaeon]